MFKRRAEDDAAPAGKAAKVANGTDGDRKATFSRNLAALNSQFASWVAEQSQSAPKGLWTDGVEDFLTYAKQLLADYKDVLDQEEQDDEPATTAAAAPAASSLFGAAAVAPKAPSAKPPLAPGSLFGGGGGGGQTGAAAAPASIFGALPSTSGAFGLGASAPSFLGFGGNGPLGASSGGAQPSSSFGGGSGAGPAAGEGEDGEGEEEQDTGPSVQVEAAAGTEILAKHEGVKLMSMTEAKKWKDKGEGTLTLRRATGESAASSRPYLVFTALSGRIMINAPLLPGMKPTSNPKQPASLIMFLISNVEGDEERCMHLFKCKGAEEAKQLSARVQELS
ncbi:hypothetical protein D9Q98_001986 [Chlorella vulgaris]|uniref:RanBD1 domain-containing protein n=1 Tax=Chlorella vulgaris TaxID=3077 RepID=A0A9D4Z0H2_CHLVU|nr:hypothetical protein D9Q98_001986 [Chlorella vulgaris]